MNNVQSRSKESNLHPAQRGGQASGPGLFGLPGNGNFGRRSVASQEAKAAPVAQSRGDDTASKVAGLTAGQRRARLPIGMVDVAARFAPTAHSKPPSFAPSMETLMVLARAQIKREREETVAPAPRPTRAMLAYAVAADAREAFPLHHDDEEADQARRCAGAGYVEATLAREGN